MTQPPNQPPQGAFGAPQDPQNGGFGPPPQFGASAERGGPRSAQPPQSPPAQPGYGPPAQPPNPAPYPPPNPYAQPGPYGRQPQYGPYPPQFPGGGAPGAGGSGKSKRGALIAVALVVAAVAIGAGAYFETRGDDDGHTPAAHHSGGPTATATPSGRGSSQSGGAGSDLEIPDIGNSPATGANAPKPTGTGFDGIWITSGGKAIAANFGGVALIDGATECSGTSDEQGTKYRLTLTCEDGSTGYASGTATVSGDTLTVAWDSGDTDTFDRYEDIDS